MELNSTYSLFGKMDVPFARCLMSSVLIRIDYAKYLAKKPNNSIIKYNVGYVVLHVLEPVC